MCMKFMRRNVRLPLLANEEKENSHFILFFPLFYAIKATTIRSRRKGIKKGIKRGFPQENIVLLFFCSIHSHTYENAISVKIINFTDGSGCDCQQKRRKNKFHHTIFQIVSLALFSKKVGYAIVYSVPLMIFFGNY